MRVAYTIQVHSTLDVITNSSSELFIIDDSTTVEAVEEMLHFMVDQWNKMALKGVFGHWYMKNERASLKNKESIPQEPLKTYDQIFGAVRVYKKQEQQADEDLLKEYSDNHPDYSYSPGWGYETPENVGKIIIESKEDNSIPYEIMNWIETAFSAKRWHLG